MSHILIAKAAKEVMCSGMAGAVLTGAVEE